MNKTFLLLGTNQGERVANLTEAKALISRELGPIITASSIYKTAAWGNENQPEFLNQVLVVNTANNPHETLTILHGIESKLGRVRIEKWGARVIDIDILFFNNETLNSTALTIPHPEIQNRMFTLKPLVEVAENFIHPVLNKSMVQLMQSCKDPLPVERLEL